MKVRTNVNAALSGLLVVTLCLATVHAQDPAFVVGFDGNDGTNWAVTSTSGDFTPTVESGGPDGNYLRLVNLTGSNNNSVALDEVAGASGPAPYGKVLEWDFRMSEDPPNGSAADGIGIGYFASAVYGATGPSNPSAEAGVIWERPAIPSAAVIGLDVYQNIDVVTLNFGGEQMTEVDVAAMGLDLNNGVFHHGAFKVEPRPDDSTKSFFSVTITEDYYGDNPIEHKVIDKFPMEFDLSTIGPNRVIAGGRTGGAFVNADLDNISVTKFVPEPTSAALLGIASLGLIMTRRRRQR